MAIQHLRAIIPGASALIKAVCDELGAARIVDERVRWDERRCKLSPGTRIVAMIVNAHWCTVPRSTRSRSFTPGRT